MIFKRKKKCKYCKETIKKLRKDSVTCGRKNCIFKYRNEYQRVNRKEYNKKYQQKQQRSLWILVGRHKTEFRKIRGELLKR